MSGRNEAMMTRSKVFAALGTKLKNPRWSWCALAPDHSRAVFTLWEDGIQNARTLLYRADSSKKLRHGEKDQKAILELVLEEEIPAYGLTCIAEDTTAAIRKIKEVKAEYLIRLAIVREREGIFGRHLNSVHLIDLIEDTNVQMSHNTGLDDLGAVPEGQKAPDRAKISGWVVIRDPKVRNYVIRNAKGRCEYCSKLGFELNSGGHYLEAHHIISLADQGDDKVDNVIALCPEHHREAHYGAASEELEQKFIKCIAKR